MWVGKKVLVTGGAGFIGSHLVEALVDRGATVTVLRQSTSEPTDELKRLVPAVKFVRADLRRRGELSIIGERQFEVVFHLSANTDFQNSIHEPISDLEQNTITTLNVLEELRKASPKTKFILASTGYIFAGSSAEPIEEDDPTHPVIPYGVSKLAAERYAMVYSNLFGLSTGIARVFSVYGPRLRKQVVYDFMQKLSLTPDRLEIMGTGEELRDMSYVTDIVDGLLLITERAELRGEAYNLASGVHSTTRQVAEAVVREMGEGARITCTMQGRIGDAKSWFADTTRLRKLGYKPKVNLSEGIASTVKWFKSEYPLDLSGGFKERRTT